MGLDVGVVRIDYLDRPNQPMYGFMQSLTDDWEIWDIYPQAPEDYIWGTIWEGNAVLEIERVNLLNRAWRWRQGNGWAAEEGCRRHRAGNSVKLDFSQEPALPGRQRYHNAAFECLTYELYNGNKSRPCVCNSL